MSDRTLHMYIKVRPHVHPHHSRVLPESPVIPKLAVQASKMTLHEQVVGTRWCFREAMVCMMRVSLATPPITHMKIHCANAAQTTDGRMMDSSGQPASAPTTPYFWGTQSWTTLAQLRAATTHVQHVPLNARKSSRNDRKLPRRNIPTYHPTEPQPHPPSSRGIPRHRLSTALRLAPSVRACSRWPRPRPATRRPATRRPLESSSSSRCVDTRH